MSDALTRCFDGTTGISNPVGYKVPLGGIRVSFETDEQGAVKVQVPFRARVTRVRSIVTKALADTDEGTVTFTSPTGEFAELTHPLSSAIAAMTFTVAGIVAINAILEPGQDITITPAKVTGGGKVSVDLDLLRMEGP